ncbi:MAG TPA: electron transfer flavoprotein subunit beta/FixA family protein [bacterium]|nr:electron transfer flavoprotein subunit beta/FixA family protein [bacterium]
MNIVVPVKSVIDVELNIRVRDGKIVEDGLNYILSKWDENALEAALQLKEATGGEVTAVTIGPERSGEALRKALAMGADKGIHVNDPATEGSDSFGYAKILAKAIQRGPFDLVITGRQAQDTDMGATGAALAELLGAPLCVNIVKIETPAGDGKLTLRRKGDVGAEVMEVTLPAVLTANDSLNEPRLASLRGIMQAKKKPMEVLTLADLGIAPDEVGAAGAGVEIVEFSPPPQRAAGKKFEGDAEEITRQVVDLLANEAKIFA